MLRLTAILLVLVSFAGCQEMRMIMPVIPGGNRVVLLEEFTGKGCTNCPKGSREIDNLLAIYDSNLVAVSIHAGFFANPDFFDIGSYDLRTDEGENIFSMLGPNIGYPAGVVNRTRFNGDYQHSQQGWADLIQQELDAEPKVEFSFTHEFDSTSRRLTVNIEGLAKEALPGEVRLSVMITESGIIDGQDDQEAGGIVDDYVHKHVLRDMATPFDGQTVAQNMQIGDPIKGNYELVLSEDWDVEHCSIIVFVAEVLSASDIKILQALENHIKD